MSTFCAIDDNALIGLIRSAQKRIVFIAPGLHKTVAEALGKRFAEVDKLDVTVVIDPDEEVCRIGYGEEAGLRLVNEYASQNFIGLRAQPGLRVGVLLVDEQTLIWSPTPRSVEAPPCSAEAPPSSSEQASLFTAPQAPSPNGLMLGSNPAQQLAKAVAAEGSNSNLMDTEIGKHAVTPDQVQQTLEELKKNPPIDVDLARVTRVFSTKLQFVEFEVKGAKLSTTQLSVPGKLLNADAKGELQHLIQSRLRAFADLKGEEIEVPAYVNGKAALDTEQKPILEKVSEASLQRLRNDIEKRYLYDITGFGRLIAKDEKSDFEARVNAYKAQVLAHSEGLRKLIEQQANQIIDEAVDLVMARAERSGAGNLPNPDQIREVLHEGLMKAKADTPTIKLVFKDVTYEQTQNKDFRLRVEKALPPPKRKQLGNWSEHFEAARESEQASA
nr:hypothetical protein [Dechloromonas sp.]